MELAHKFQKVQKNWDIPRSGSFSEHLAVESMGGRHTPLPHPFDAHRLKLGQLLSLSEPSLEGL
jgi:hypothetical protein